MLRFRINVLSSKTFRDLLKTTEVTRPTAMISRRECMKSREMRGVLSIVLKNTWPNYIPLISGSGRNHARVLRRKTAYGFVTYRSAKTHLGIIEHDAKNQSGGQSQQNVHLPLYKGNLIILQELICIQNVF